MRGPTPPLSIAPMLDRTDRHYRYMLRLLTKHTLLYTEMVTSGAIMFGDTQRHLAFNDCEHPIALQLGGDDPNDLSRCAVKAVSQYGYDEINLNVGCPSDRVLAGHFGASMMLRPEVVAQCVRAIRRVVSVPVTVKHRIGIDDHEEYNFVHDFVAKVSDAGCDRFSVHARSAWLDGLNPKENRNIPPLKYHYVHRLKKDFPHLQIELNGGILSLETAKEQLQYVDAVMIGRFAYDRPYVFAQADKMFFDDDRTVPTRIQVIEKMASYADEHIAKGGKLHAVSRHLLNIFAGCRGGKQWRRFLSENVPRKGSTGQVLLDSLDIVQGDAGTVTDERLEGTSRVEDLGSRGVANSAW